MSQNKYAHQIDPEGGSAAARIARMIEPGLRVLELGCGPGTVTRILHAKGCRVTGMDMDGQALEVCRPFCDRVIQTDLSAAGWVQAVKGEIFDVVVLADVLEHLNCPQDLLDALANLLADDGYVVLSVPNVSHLSVLSCLMAGHFPYQSTGLLDRTHVRFFGRHDVEQLLLASGFLAQRWEYVEVPPLASELASFWTGLDESARHFLQDHTVNGMVYQHVVKAYPSSQTGYVAKLQAELAQLQSGMNHLKESHEASLDHEKALRNELMAQKEHLTSALAALSREVEALKRSRSWRITSPMRALSRWLFHSV
jgi:2-polyprenyl-3-methyl-5-hydroxy-6-metoxy-1,4-benzoquinol methylase